MSLSTKNKSNGRWARRVQLAVKSQFQPTAQFPTDEESSHVEHSNIDEALQSLYDDFSVAVVSSSYLPQVPADWLLDGALGISCDATKRQEADLFHQLHADPLPDVERKLTEWEAQNEKEDRIQQELEHWDAFPVQKVFMIESVDDFGDYQCAEDATSFSEGTVTISQINQKCNSSESQDSEMMAAQSPIPEEEASCNNTSSNFGEVFEEKKASEGDHDEPKTTPCEQLQSLLDESLLISEIDESEIDDASIFREAVCPAQEIGDEEEAVSDTPGLVLRADQLLEHMSLCSPESANSFDTPELLRRSEDLLRRAETMQEQDNGKYFFSGDCLPTPTRTHERRLSTPTEATAIATSHQRRQSESDISTKHEGAKNSPDATAILSPIFALKTVELVPLSLRLPIEDLSTLEARFTRRRQDCFHNGDGENRLLDNTYDSARPNFDELDLPSYFFTNPDIDDTATLLESMPWQYVLPPTGGGSPNLVATSHGTEDSFDPTEHLAMWDEHTTKRLCDLDSALELVQKELMMSIMPHRKTLEHTNGILREWEQNLRLAFIYWKRSQEAVNSAQGSEVDASGLAGQCALLDMWKQRAENESLKTVISEIELLQSRERDLFDRIDRFDVAHSDAYDEYCAVMDLAQSLEQVANCGTLSKLYSLDEMRLRLKSIGNRFWERLLDLAKAAVIRCCRKRGHIDWTEYGRLVQAMLDLDFKTSVDKAVNSDLVSSWTQNILATMFYEVDRAVAIALLDPFGVEVSKMQVELVFFGSQVDQDWGDTTKLRSLAHNLVTIRFEVEADKNHLPGVIRRLCQQLTNIIHAYVLFLQWHTSPLDGHTAEGNLKIEHTDLSSILYQLKGGKDRLWDCCEQGIIFCLDEYLHFTPRRNLFQHIGRECDDSAWQNDVYSLHETLLLVDRFASLRESFPSENSKDEVEFGPLSSRRSSRCFEKLSDIFRRHLRLVHVEAMNTIGRCLARESWILETFSIQPDSEHERTELQQPYVESILLNAIVQALPPKHCSPYQQNCLISENDRRSTRGHSQSVVGPNPFDSSILREYGEQFCSQETDFLAVQLSLTKRLSSLRRMDEGHDPSAPKSVTRDIVGWFTRLAVIIQKLPLITQDVSLVFCNLCDLYATTAFRICAGNIQSEQLVLGEVRPPPLLDTSEMETRNPDQDENSVGPPIFASFRKTQRRDSLGRSGIRHTRVAIPVKLDAEICSPLLRDMTETKRLCSYLARAQNSLSDVVNLDMVDSWVEELKGDTLEEATCEAARVLAKREGAIRGCLVVSELLEAVCLLVDTNLSRILPKAHAISELAALKSYCQATAEVAPTMIRVARKIACMRAVDGVDIVNDILDCKAIWEERRLHEHANEYIDDLCDRCSLIWGYLKTSAKLPAIVLDATWDNLISAAYHALLEGFSRVPNCSTEGRALMSLDVASFVAGTSPGSVEERAEDIAPGHRPPVACPEFGSQYVATYIKVFYFPKDDVLSWIRENCGVYKENQALALIASISTNPDQRQESSFSDLRKVLKACYSENAEKPVIAQV
jgi:Protein of unknown function C-terminus (DUF2451)